MIYRKKDYEEYYEASPTAESIRKDAAAEPSAPPVKEPVPAAPVEGPEEQAVAKTVPLEPMRVPGQVPGTELYSAPKFVGQAPTRPIESELAARRAMQEQRVVVEESLPAGTPIRIPGQVPGTEIYSGARTEYQVPTRVEELPYVPPPAPVYMDITHIPITVTTGVVAWTQHPSGYQPAKPPASTPGQ
jgi:hypothetical protein